MTTRRMTTSGIRNLKIFICIETSSISATWQFRSRRPTDERRKPKDRKPAKVGGGVISTIFRSKYKNLLLLIEKKFYISH